MRPVLLALIVGVLIYGLAIGTTYPLLGVILSGEVDAFRNGLNAAGTGVGLLLGVALVGPAARRLGAGRTVLAGVAIMTGSLLLMAVAPDYWSVLAGRILLGVGANFLFVICETALNALSAPHERGRVMGWYTAATALGFAIGPLAVSVAAERPLPLLVGCAVLTALCALPFARTVRPITQAVSAPTLRGFTSLLKAGAVAFSLLLAAALVDAVMISLLPVISLERGEGVARGALLAAVFHVGLIVGQPLVGRALDRFGRAGPLVFCLLASTVAALLMASPWGAGPVTGVVVMTLWGATNYALYTGALTLIGDRFSEASLSGAIALFAAVYALASAVAPGLAGLALKMVGAEGLYLLMAGLYVGLLIILARRFRRRDAARSEEV